jgi:hypothetical protein
MTRINNASITTTFISAAPLSTSIGPNVTRPQAVSDVLFSGLLPGLGSRLDSNNFDKLLNRIAKYSRDGMFTENELSNISKLAARLYEKERRSSAEQPRFSAHSVLVSVNLPTRDA